MSKRDSHLEAEEAMVGLAVSSGPELAAQLDAVGAPLAEHLAGCARCQHTGYELLAEIPALEALLGAPAADHEEGDDDEGLLALEQLLADASVHELESSGAEDKDIDQRAEKATIFLLRPRVLKTTAAVTLAAAAALLILPRLDPEEGDGLKSVVVERSVEVQLESIEGDLTPDDVTGALDAQLRELNRCAEAFVHAPASVEVRATVETNGLTGTLSLAAGSEGSGAAGSDPELGSCLEGVLRNVAYPFPDRPTSLVLRFQFRPPTPSPSFQQP